MLIAVLVWAGFKYHDNPMRYFGEGRPGTTATFVTFLLAGFTALQTWKMLRPDRFARFWFVAAVGLFFLAIDEQFKAHETMDVVVNRLLGADPEGKTADRLDNLIVMAYAPLAGILAWPFRRELLGMRKMIAVLAVGFVFFVAMAYLDDHDSGGGIEVQQRLGAAEESFKLLSAISIMNGIIAAKHAVIARRRQAAPESAADSREDR